MADVEDIKPQLDMECLENKCQRQVKSYEQCLERIKDVPADKEPHCFPWYFEIVQCVDKCSHAQVWASLK
jgi:ubiquinol-cytochrome c reductase subunit 6